MTKKKSLPFVHKGLRVVNRSSLNYTPVRQIFHHCEVRDHLLGLKVNQDQGARVSLFDPDVPEEVISIGCAVEELGAAEEDGLVLSELGQEAVDGGMAVQGVDLASEKPRINKHPSTNIIS